MCMVFRKNEFSKVMDQVNNFIVCRISYIHLMAHYKMCVQLRDQSRAFFHGFREFIQHDWLGIFSGPELQKLISGDSTTLDVSDLRYVEFFNFCFWKYFSLFYDAIRTQ